MLAHVLVLIHAAAVAHPLPETRSPAAHAAAFAVHPSAARRFFEDSEPDGASLPLLRVATTITGDQEHPHGSTQSAVLHRNYSTIAVLPYRSEKNERTGRVSTGPMRQSSLACHDLLSRMCHALLAVRVLP